METALAMAPVVGIVAVCVALGLSRATYYRRRRAARAVASSGSSGTSPPDEQGGLRPVPARDEESRGATVPPPVLEQETSVEAAQHDALPEPLTDDEPIPDVPGASAAPGPAKKSSPRALSETERAAVLATLNEDRFCNQAPAEVYATLLDEDRYLCSERTMYRILDENSQIRERRNQLRHPQYVAPELMVASARQPLGSLAYQAAHACGRIFGTLEADLLPRIGLGHQRPEQFVVECVAGFVGAESP